MGKACHRHDLRKQVVAIRNDVTTPTKRGLAAYLYFLDISDSASSLVSSPLFTRIMIATSF